MSTNIPDNAPRGILDVDESIRFVGFTDKSGKNMVYEYRENVEPLLTEEELREQSTIQVQLMNNIDLGPKLGRPIFYLSYKKNKVGNNITR
jgi:hypothetical protein